MGVERRNSTQHFVKDTTESPPVHRFPMSLLLYNFGRQILRRSTNWKRVFVWLYFHFWKSEISNSYISLRVYKNILRFQISIDNIVWMQIFKCQEYLSSIKKSPKILLQTVLHWIFFSSKVDWTTHPPCNIPIRRIVFYHFGNIRRVWQWMDAALAPIHYVR